MRRHLGSLASAAAAASAHVSSTVVRSSQCPRTATQINRHAIGVLKPLSSTSGYDDQQAGLAALVHGLFYSNWRRLGDDRFREFVSSVSGVQGIGALTTRSSIGLPASVKGSTNEDELVLFFHKILLEIEQRQLTISDGNSDEIMKIVTDVIANDDSKVYSKLQTATELAYQYYREVSGFQNIDRNLVEEQVRLETMSRELSAFKYRRLREDLTSRKQLANMKVSQRILLDWYAPLTIAIEREQRQIENGTERKYDHRGYEVEMLLLPADLIAVVTLHEVLNMTVRNPEVIFVKIALEVGRAIWKEVSLRQSCSNGHNLRKPKTSRLALARNELLREANWSTSSYIKLGSRLIQLLIETARMPNDPTQFAFSHVISSLSAFKKRGMLCMNSALSEHINMSHLKREALSTSFLPMVVPPLPWVMTEYGGYLSTRSTVMRVRGSKDQKTSMQNGDLSKVYEALNIISSVPWRINSRVLSVLNKYWENGGGVPSLPSREDFPLPDYSKDDRESVRKYTAVRRQNQDLHSLRCDLELKLEVARMFNGHDLYLPHNIDFRGRAYTIPPHLQHMGNDASRGLLTFAEKKSLGPRGLFWLKVQIANLFGNDKISFEDRVKWTDSVTDQIYRVIEDPVGYKWWLEADSPWQFLACCYEIVDALKCPQGPEHYLSSLPIHMDGSCNGLQHYAAMGLDELGGRAVNLSASADGKPADVYMRVCDLVNKQIDEDVTKNHKLACKLQGHVGRKIVKQTVMTSVYGVTFVGAREQIERRLKELEGFDTLDSSDMFEFSTYLTKLTFKSLGNMFSSAQNIMDWMVRSARIIANSTDQPVAWVTPLGLPVVQPYRRTHQYTVKTSVQSVVLVDTESLLPVSGQRQCSAFPPNYVHSLDSTHMMMTARACRQNQITFAAVHDSFWTHACSVDKMNKILREKFVELHSQPLLESLADSFRLRYPMCTFPELPKRGTLNLHDVLNSPFFFN